MSETEISEPIENTETSTTIEPIEMQETKTKGKISKPKISKPKFEGTCTNCSKLFKQSKLYEKHINEQVCYKKDDITYCKLCLHTYNSHNDYKTHLFSIEHINNIGVNNVEKIKKPSTNIVHNLDPYLNTNDINKLSLNNLGDNFTFVFEKGNTQTITLQQTKKDTVNKIDTVDTVDTVNTVNTTKNTNDTVEINTSSEILEPTPRQVKIINFLEKQILTVSIHESGNNFYKMLDNKLQLEDYKGLQKIIINLPINEEFKQNYLKTIDIFISFLVKEKTMGNTFYKDKDISQLVINLTS